jgi:hypothetical protein
LICDSTWEAKNPEEKRHNINFKSTSLLSWKYKMESSYLLGSGAYGLQIQFLIKELSLKLILISGKGNS